MDGLDGTDETGTKRQRLRDPQLKWDPMDGCMGMGWREHWL